MTNLKFAALVLSLCVLWYAISSTNNVLNKVILEKFPYPLTMTISSLIASSLYCVPLMMHLRLPVWKVPQGHHLWRFVIPLAFGKVVAQSCAYFSISKVPVSFAHTVKATMPLFAVFCARCILHERQTQQVYISLLPIMCGVMIATLTELSFHYLGFLSALVSTFAYALLNTFVKKVLQDTGLHHIKLLSLISVFASCVFLPVWFYEDVLTWMSDTEDASLTYSSTNILGLIICSSFLSFLQNIVTFTLIHKLTALSYAVANCAKRIIVISISLLALHNPVTSTNVFGMMMAVVGVLAYNRAKYVQTRRDNVKLPVYLPDSMSDATLVERTGEFAVVSDFIASPLQESNMLAANSYRHQMTARSYNNNPLGPTLNGIDSSNGNSPWASPRGRERHVHPRFVVGENNNDTNKFDVI